MIFLWDILCNWTLRTFWAEPVKKNLRMDLCDKKYVAKYAYLGALNMVKWGVPEKILQNAVQTR